MTPTPFLSGVIEGFYGTPWTRAERAELFEWMVGSGLDTYVYAPKDDLHHRSLWRDPYSAADADQIAALTRACQDRGIRFVYALSPGLDIRYRDDGELDRLKTRFAQLMRLGCEDFSLLFDDIPDDLDPQDLDRWGSLASAQCHVANALLLWTRERLARPDARFMFCPTPYCGRMAARKLGGDGYLATLGAELAPDIDVFWTGPDIVSREITVAHVQEVAAMLRRKPLIWDNLNANDYAGDRFFCGPYAGRPLELRTEVAGLLTNPNNELLLNRVPLQTLAAFVRCQGAWNPRQAYLAAMQEWRPAFDAVGGQVSLDDLILFGDCFYLPYDEGDRAEALYGCVRRLVAEGGRGEDEAFYRREAARLREVCVRITELRHRPLFHALFRRVWDLRETLDLIDRYLSVAAGHGGAGQFRVPERRGLVARLERLLSGGVIAARTGPPRGAS